MKLYHKQFAEDLDQPVLSLPATTVLIASTPRCGSHMLGHALASTGLMGVPFEYANPANLAEWARRLGTASSEATLQAVMQRRTTPNGIFAIKAHYSHCKTLGGAARFLAHWPNLKVVQLCRTDLLRQAISYAVARQTGVWIDGQEAEQDQAGYDPRLIAECLDDIAMQNARWISAFAAAGITPLTVSYGDAVDDLAGTVSRIARHVGVIGAERTLDVTATTARQGQSGRSEDWIRRYDADRRRTGSQGFGIGRLLKSVRS
jgi:trehalose 2-sulfotransferase